MVEKNLLVAGDPETPRAIVLAPKLLDALAADDNISYAKKLD